MTDITDHIILVGLGRIGVSILELLRDLGEKTVVITRELRPEWRRRVEAISGEIIVGDARNEDSLIEAGLAGARAIIVATDDDLSNLEIALDARRLAPELPIVLRMQDNQLAERVRRDMDFRAVLNPAELSAPAFIAAALGSELLRAFEVEDASVNIITIRAVGKEEEPETIRSLSAKLDMIPLALRAGSEDHALSPSLNTALNAGDEVVFAASQTALHDLQHSEHASDDLAHRHGHDHPPVGRHRDNTWERPGTGPLAVLKAIWANSAPVFRGLAIALPIIVLCSVVIFHHFMHLSWVDALYFTITIITTVGFGDIHLSGAPDALKLFGCFLMVTGASMLVVFYSIITEYIVSRRLEAILAPKTTTLSDHVVVVGLGGIGRRVATRLSEVGEPVLVVEQDNESTAVGRLSENIPILFGDATQRSTLERAGVQRARAVVAVTEDDLVNLRIAQQSEILNKEARTIVRLFRSSLAGKLGTSILGVDQPLNPSEAAAATFAASALADDVLQGFTLGPRLLMLRWLDASRMPTCVQHTVGDLRENQNILVILRRPAGKQELQDAKSEDLIEDGDRLVILEEYRISDRAPASCRIVNITEDDFDVNSQEWDFGSAPVAG
jgi:Trk K+ transport system NAD-binding subunit